MKNHEQPSTGNVKASLEKQAEFLYDHYKESINVLSSLIGRRMRVAILIFITLAAMVFQGTAPASANSLAAQFISSAAGGKDLASKLNMDPRFISSLIWFLLAGLTVQAYSYSLLVELQSNYLKRIDGYLDEYLSRPLISCRRVQRPRYFRLANFLYAQVFMVLLSVVVSGKIYLELKESLSGDGRTVIFALIDLIMALVIFFYSFSFIQDFRKIGRDCGDVPAT